VPAPEVIPAPQAYTNVAVVKTFVVRVSVFRRLTGLGQPPSLKGNFRGLGGPDVALSARVGPIPLVKHAVLPSPSLRRGALGFMVSAGEYDSQL